MPFLLQQTSKLLPVPQLLMQLLFKFVTVVQNFVCNLFGFFCLQFSFVITMVFGYITSMRTVANISLLSISLI